MVFDWADPARLATFCPAPLHYKQQDPPAGFATWPAFLEAQGVPEAEWNSANAVVDLDGPGPRIYFQHVPEPKIVKHRVQLEVNVGGDGGSPLDERRTRGDAEVERLISIGATTMRALEQRGEYWVGMQDPDGNEVCLQ